MAVDHPRHMGLGTTDDDTLVILFYDVDEQIRVALLARPFAAVTLRVGHGTGYHKIRILDVFEEFLEAFMIMCAVFLVHFKGRAIGGIHGIEADAALIAGPCFEGEHAQHFDFFDQVFHTLVNVGEAVDFFARQVGRSRHQVFICRVKGQVIRYGSRIDVAADEGMIRQFFSRNLFALKIYDDITFP